MTRIRRKLSLALVTAIVGAGAWASTANAYVDFFYGAMGQYGTATSNWYYIRAVAGWADGSNHKAGVWAYLYVQDGQPVAYGQEVSDWGYVCHSYAGGNLLQGGLRNPHSVGQNPMRGRVRVNPESAC